jgi:hypothetical protein
MYCWALDSEFPVACDEEADEEEGFRFQVSGSREGGSRAAPET